MPCPYLVSSHMLVNMVHFWEPWTASAAHLPPFHAGTMPAAFPTLNTVLQWRDIECLTVSPPTFKALKQIPELQQLIAFTAADVVAGKESSYLHTVLAGEACHSVQANSRSQISSVEQLIQ